MFNKVSEGDRLAKMLVEMSWFNADPAKENVNECTLVEQKIIKQMGQADLTAVKPKDLGQMLAYVTKAKDVNARLVQFSAGAPDSRTEMVLDDILPLLSNEELAIVSAAFQRIKNTQATGDAEQLQ